MDTLGSIIDKLTTVNLKMWNAQEFLYKIRKLSFEDFKKQYETEKGLKELYNIFKNSCDLNYQRNVLIDEIDEFIVNLIKEAIDKKDISKYIQRKHKTY